MKDNTGNKTNVISEETVYQAKYFRVVRKVIERNGKQFTKDFIQRNTVVYILPVTEQGEIYLERQYRDAFGKEGLEIVAGTIENDDDPLESAKRELKEETGLTAKKWNQISVNELSVNLNSKQYIYVATNLTEGQADPDEDEEIKLIKMPFSEAVEKVLSGEIYSATHIAAILLYDKLKSQGKL